jgi:hypothetical protein
MGLPAVLVTVEIGVTVFEITLATYTVLLSGVIASAKGGGAGPALAPRLGVKGKRFDMPGLVVRIASTQRR